MMMGRRRTTTTTTMMMVMMMMMTTEEALARELLVMQDSASSAHTACVGKGPVCRSPTCQMPHFLRWDQAVSGLASNWPSEERSLNGGM